MYCHPRIYNLTLRILHGRMLSKRYCMISAEIGNNKSVLDVGCGTGLLSMSLEPSCTYMGIDLNEKFIEYAVKNGLNVKKGDILDPDNYPKYCDVIVLSDILHHVTPNHEKLIEICKKRASRVIVCESYNDGGAKNEGFNRLRSSRWYHNVFGDHDGINEFEDMKVWNSYTKEDVAALMKNHGAKRITPVGSSIIGVIDT
ncbi:MAG: hypothetical protein MSIBF_07185 [Candidatus Altiarchaeales archaeon IMC4]|nr:MAG: hypothetical protein MSIBF_07185 [Candidatus Altiarchaeales archaeon IMC4]